MLKNFNERHERNIKIGFDAKRLYHNKTGLGNYSRDLLKILKKSYPNNKYILFNPKYKDDIFFNEENGFQQVSPLGFFKKIHAIWRTLFLKSNTIFKQIDIYHGLSAEIPLDTSRKVKKIVTIHDLIFIRYPKLYSFWDRNIHIMKHRYAIKNSDVVVAISEQTKEDILNNFDVHPDKVKVIYQSCAEIFKKNEFSSEEYLQLREKYSLPENYILNVGTIEERKNALSIVKAIKDIDTHLVIIGKRTSYTKIIEDYITENNLQDKVSLLHNVPLDELAKFYKKSTLFVYPSIFEGFGIPILEALYSGIPVITNKDGVFKEAGGVDSCYVDVNNIEELSTAITSLLENKELRDKMSKSGLNFVQKFTDENLGTEWNTLYNNVIENETNF